MSIRTLTPPAAVLALAAAALLSVEGGAYTLLGHSLGLDQRDFRVFDNFINPEANDNTTPHPSFPGQTGAVMAIWKASVEWGSELHGDGEGDPHQPGDLGSGGANFDATFQGLADDAGALGGNVHSALPCSGGMIAYTELSPGGGWRIRYCSNLCWDDGPSPLNPFGCVDIQGVATHEYGHAIGLGHSSVPGSTMYPSGAGSAALARSIEADDRAGIQAIYGAAGPTKPRITAAVVSGAQLELTGASFAPVQNEVWFTRAGVGGDGTPVTVSGVPSSGGGTQITVTIPSDATSGDVLVRTGFGGDDLSNAFPVAICFPPGTYCIAAPNSAGAGARIGASGSTSVSANDLVLTCDGGPPNQNGVFYYGLAPDQAPFGDGFRCVAGAFCRLPVTSFGPSGSASFAVDLAAPPSPACEITPGSTRYFQLWYRDPAAGGSGFNLSDGLSATFCP